MFAIKSSRVFFVDASAPKNRARMSLSIPTTHAPSSANRFTVSEPINPADPVTMIARIYSTVIVKTICPRIRVTSLCEMGPYAIRSIADLAPPSVYEKVNVPSGIDSNSARIEGNRTTPSHERQLHIEALEHLDKFFPVNTRLLQARGPEFEQEIDTCVFLQHALRAA